MLHTQLVGRPFEAVVNSTDPIPPKPEQWVPSTLSPSLYTQPIKPYTLNFNPYTLHPVPRTFPSTP